MKEHLALKIRIYRSFGAPDHGKYVVGDINTIDKRYPRKKICGLSKIPTANCEGLGMIQYVSNKLTISFAKYC